MRTTIVTLAAGNHSRIAEETLGNKAKYASLHGYSLVSFGQKLDQSRPAAWSKILAIESVIRSSDLVAWMDADAVVVDMDQKIEPMVDSGIDVAIAAENGSDGTIHPNSGFIVFRNTPDVIELLRQWWNSPGDESEASIGTENGGPWDQPHLRRLLRIRGGDMGIAVLGDAFNARPSRRGWKFLVHPLGGSAEDKLDKLRPFLK